MRSTFLNFLTRTFIKHLLLTIIFGICIFACVNSNEITKKKETRFITDMNNRVVEIPVKINKVVAHRSGALRMVCYLEAAELIIGIEANERRRNVPYLYAYPELKKLPLIGSGNFADPELILLLQPDVIICTYLNKGEADELQTKSGIPVVCLDYGDFNEKKENFYTSLRLLGEVLDKSDRAKFLINYIETEFEQIKAKCRKKNSNTKVYVGGIAFRGSHGINSTEPKYAPFRYTNAKNVAKPLTNNPNLSPSKLNNIIIDKEQIIEWNPDKIFIDVSGYTLSKPDFEKQSILGKLLPAVQKDEIYFLLPHIWNTINYENILINTIFIAKVLYPELYKDIDFVTEANKIYQIFLGKPLYKDLQKLYGLGCQKITEDE